MADDTGKMERPWFVPGGTCLLSSRDGLTPWVSKGWSSLPSAHLVAKVRFHRESLKNRVMHVNPGRTAAGSACVVHLSTGKSGVFKKHLSFSSPVNGKILNRQTKPPNQKRESKLRPETMEVGFHLEYHFSPKTIKS